MLKHENTPFCGLGISTLFMLAMIYQTAVFGLKIDTLIERCNAQTSRSIKMPKKQDKLAV